MHAMIHMLPYNRANYHLNSYDWKTLDYLLKDDDGNQKTIAVCVQHLWLTIL